VVETLEELKLEYPTVTQDKRTELQTIRQLLVSEED
jgi:hypothetical protein